MKVPVVVVSLLGVFTFVLYASQSPSLKIYLAPNNIFTTKFFLLIIYTKIGFNVLMLAIYLIMAMLE